MLDGAVRIKLAVGKNVAYGKSISATDADVANSTPLDTCAQNAYERGVANVTGVVVKMSRASEQLFATVLFCGACQSRTCICLPCADTNGQMLEQTNATCVQLGGKYLVNEKK